MRHDDCSDHHHDHHDMTDVDHDHDQTMSQPYTVQCIQWWTQLIPESEVDDGDQNHDEDDDE